ncbi:MAG: hypothetical protein E2O85_02060 [Bacteroidetes bacterium]|nr:MAG: hypothetical protein E2O85_02060 [Bacteroidota bacterium]
MERLKCKACNCYSMVPMEVSLEAEEIEDPDADSKFYTCHVCGDNWLSVREGEDTGESRVTFVHQMGMSPILKRVAHLQKHVVLKETTVEKWEYFFDDEEIEEKMWQEKLANRRKILKSICTN